MNTKSSKPKVKEGRLRSFGRLASRMSGEEQQALDARLAPFSLTCNTQDITHFIGNKKCVIELGIGNGELMAVRAQNEPETQFIGAEVYKNGLRTLGMSLEKNNITNAKIVGDDARNLLDALASESVDELVVLYPDPWPKTKHKKRRIVNEELLIAAERVLKSDGILFLATDIPDYALWMLREIYTHNAFFPIAIDPSEWAQAPTWWHSTKYERKATKMGRKPWYMTFKKNVDRTNTKCPPEVKQ